MLNHGRRNNKIDREEMGGRADLCVEETDQILWLQGEKLPIGFRQVRSRVPFLNAETVAQVILADRRALERRIWGRLRRSRLGRETDEAVESAYRLSWLHHAAFASFLRRRGGSPAWKW